MYALALAHFTQRAICAIASFLVFCERDEQKCERCEQEKTRSNTNLRFVLLDIFFAFCYNARIETNFVDAVWAMRCSTRPGKISEEL